MKRILALLLILALAISSTFALDYAIGLQTGYAQDVSFSENRNYATSILPLKADAMIYLNDSVALNASLGTNVYFPENTDESKAGLVADFLAYYDLEVGDKMDLYLGGGLSYRYRGWSTGNEYAGASVSVNQLALLGSLRFEFEPIDRVIVFAGLDLGFNVVNNTTTRAYVLDQAGDSTSSSNLNVMPWALKAGAAYKF